MATFNEQDIADTGMMTDREKSFKLRYVGARFNGAKLPVDVLLDLPAFRDLLVAFAKDEWLDINAGRQRVPKGFEQSISLDLVAIEDGSAIPKLNWNREAAQANLPGFADSLEEIVDRSYQDVVGLIDGAGRGEFPASLSSQHIRALNRLGSGLRDHEKIEFVGTSDSNGNVVYLDNFRRKALIVRVRETYQARFESVGVLLGADTDLNGTGHIKVSTSEHGELFVALDADRVREEFDGHIGTEVQLDLQIEMDNDDRFRSIIDIFHVGLIGPDVGEDLLRCRNRLTELADLEPGWHDGHGSRISTTAIEEANRFLSKRPSSAKSYRLYPTDAGGVLFEFESAGWDLSVEISSSGEAEFYGVQIDGDLELEADPPRKMDEAFFAEFDRRVKGILQ